MNRLLHTLVDCAGDTYVAVARVGDIEWDVLLEDFVVYVADERHLGLGSKVDLIRSTRGDIDIGVIKRVIGELAEASFIYIPLVLLVTYLGLTIFR